MGKNKMWLRRGDTLHDICATFAFLYFISDLESMELEPNYDKTDFIINTANKEKVVGQTKTITKVSNIKSHKVIDKKFREAANDIAPLRTMLTPDKTGPMFHRYMAVVNADDSRAGPNRYADSDTSTQDGWYEKLYSVTETSEIIEFLENEMGMKIPDDKSFSIIKATIHNLYDSIRKVSSNQESHPFIYKWQVSEWLPFVAIFGLLANDNMKRWSGKFSNGKTKYRTVDDLITRDDDLILAHEITERLKRPSSQARDFQYINELAYLDKSDKSELNKLLNEFVRDALDTLVKVSAILVARTKKENYENK